MPKKNASGDSETPVRVRTSSRKRKSIDPSSPSPAHMGKREEINSHISTWNDESLDKLTTYLQENGFDHDFLALQKEFPAFSHHSLRAFFNELSRWSSDAAVNPLEDEVEAQLAKKKFSISPSWSILYLFLRKTQLPKREQKYSPNEEWINTIRDHLESQRLGPNLPHIFKFIALFEEHPDPDTVLGVDYKSIYMYISALMEVFYSFSVFCLFCLFHCSLLYITWEYYIHTCGYLKVFLDHFNFFQNSLSFVKFIVLIGAHSWDLYCVFTIWICFPLSTDIMQLIMNFFFISGRFSRL